MHILAAIVALGGAAFLRFALAPAARATLADDDHGRLRDAVRARWAKLVHAAIAVLLLTGVVNFVVLVLIRDVDPMPYHGVFGVKFVAALGVFFLASALVGRGAGFSAMRANPRRPLTLILVLGALIVLLSGLLGQIRTRAGPNPDNDATSQS